MNKTFLFDLDDTLIENQTKYTLAQTEFIRFIVERIGHRAPDAKTIMNLQVSIDLDLVKTSGFSTDRFPASFREAYRRICEKIGFQDGNGEAIAYNIGKKVFDEGKWLREGRGMIKGAIETLDFLAQSGDELRLLTLGDSGAQIVKIETYRLRKWFGDKVFITQKKDRQAFLRAAGSNNPRDIWVVGNSIRSDVTPALEAGMKVVYLPCETWDYDREHKGLPSSKDILVLNEIREMISRYDEIS